MPYTDEDDEDLKRIVGGKAGMFSKEYGRQFKGNRSEGKAKPKSTPMNPLQPGGSEEDWEAAGGRSGVNRGEVGKKWSDVFFK